MKTIFLCFTLLLAFASKAQVPGSDLILLMDKDWEQIQDQKKAIYFIHIYQLNDSCWSHEYYNFKGPMMKIESYRDKEGTKPHGQFYYYSQKGLLDSGGYVFDGRKDRDWFYHFTEETKFEKYQKGKLISSEIKKKTFGATKKDTTVKKEDIPGEVESMMVGGLPAWACFLNKNLRYPQRAIDFVIQGTVWIQFIVDKDGTVIDPVIAKSVEFSIDNESMRIIKLSDKWNPATKDGVAVKSYKIQPIIFRLE